MGVRAITKVIGYRRLPFYGIHRFQQSGCTMQETTLVRSGRKSHLQLMTCWFFYVNCGIGSY